MFSQDGDQLQVKWEVRYRDGDGREEKVVVLPVPTCRAVSFEQVQKQTGQGQGQSAGGITFTEGVCRWGSTICGECTVCVLGLFCRTTHPVYRVVHVVQGLKKV